MRVVAFIFVLALLAELSVAMPKGFGRKKESTPILRDDLKYIKCDACQLVAKQAYRVVKDLRDSLPSWDKLSENTILEKLETMCQSDKEGAGDWLTKLDIQEDGDKLIIVEMESMGDCRRECATIARVCDDLIGEHDIELSEVLYKPKSNRKDITQALCHDLSGVCNKKPPPFKGPRKDGEDFEVLDEDKLKLKRMIASMSEQGMSGNLFSRDNMMEQMAEYEENLEDYGYSMDDLKNMASGAGSGASTDAEDVGNDEGDEL